jgi:hypothetical protein
MFIPFEGGYLNGDGSLMFDVPIDDEDYISVMVFDDCEFWEWEYIIYDDEDYS